MKKLIIMVLCAFAVLSAQEADSNVTKIKISDMQYYDVVSTNPKNDLMQADGFNKPFAFKQPSDKWFSKDKWMHFTTTYFLTLQSSYTMNKMFYTNAEDARYISIGISLGFSIGKEFNDVYMKKEIFSWKDLLYDILGTGLGYLTATALQ